MATVHDPKFQQKCQICGDAFRFGPHIFDGRRIGSYDLFVCRACWIDNWNGWGADAEPKLEAHLMAHGIPLPARNRNGCYPRGDQ